MSMPAFFTRFLLAPFIVFNLTAQSWAQNAPTPDWSQDATIGPGTDRSNIYGLGPVTFRSEVYKGKNHALHYFVTSTQALIPYQPLKNFLESDKNNPLKKFILKQIKKEIGFNDLPGLYSWLGLSNYPLITLNDIFSPYYIPLPPNPLKRPLAVGASLMSWQQNEDEKASQGMTFSCASCHSAQLFGKTVLGAANKVSRANELFVLAQKYAPLVPSPLFALATKANKEEVAMFKQAQQSLRRIGGVAPQVLGLDTALAQVALSLNKRASDEWASFSTRDEIFPKFHPLMQEVADSKPMPWWNLKYKTRWLSDGSVISGNPVITNILWNEIGRGADLQKLDQWLKDNQQKVRELTAAVFSSSAPLWIDFFGSDSIQIDKAKRGEKIFNRTCASCHGTYEKGWSHPLARFRPKSYQLATTKVTYHAQTPVLDVGTDEARFKAMGYLAPSLNQLQLSKNWQIEVQEQSGYVPPPLEGIWSRYPYLHNGSVPTLCALLSKAQDRPEIFYTGPAVDKNKDFDQNCVGYPLGEKTPEEFKVERQKYDTHQAGLSNRGHESMLIDGQGQDILSQSSKMDLIEYLKTL